MTTLPPIAEEFLTTLNRSPKTIRTYQNALTQFFALAQDGNLTTDAYITFLRSLRHHATSTQKVYSTAVRRLYKFARIGNESEMEEATDHYTEASTDSLVSFNFEAVEKFIAHCERLDGDLFALRDRAAALCYADTGLRLEELTARKIGEIDFIGKRAIIKGKRRKHAVIRFSDRAIEALNKYIQARANVEPNGRRPLSSQPLFARHDITASKKIKPIHGTGLREALKGRMEEAGLDRHEIRIHDLRHYFVTRVYRGSKNPKIAQEAARHESPAMTARYAHLVSGELDNAYDQIINKGKSL